MGTAVNWPRIEILPRTEVAARLARGEIDRAADQIYVFIRVWGTIVSHNCVRIQVQGSSASIDIESTLINTINNVDSKQIIPHCMQLYTRGKQITTKSGGKNQAHKNIASVSDAPLQYTHYTRPRSDITNTALTP